MQDNQANSDGLVAFQSMSQNGQFAYCVPMRQVQGFALNDSNQIGQNWTSLAAEWSSFYLASDRSKIKRKATSW